MRVESIQHVQLAIPAGAEPAARNFYAELLGIPEVAKPADLAANGGCWFEDGPLRVHLGVDNNFVPAKKAHPALVVSGLDELVELLTEAGVEVRPDNPVVGYNRVFVDDPFGNRIELMEPISRL
ncbi:MAG: VOC family protein [Acidimicrobiales bacterium]